jgi:nucleoside-diphosphate-sugar epimerase
VAAILITGGAGFIGSNFAYCALTVRDLLVEANEQTENEEGAAPARRLKLSKSYAAVSKV